MIHAEFIDECQVLIHRLNAKRAGVGYRAEFDLLPVDKNLAVIGLQETREYLDEG